MFKFCKHFFFLFGYSTYLFILYFLYHSALIFYSLNFPSQLVKELDANEVKPDVKEAIACLMIMTKCLLNLIGRIQE